MKNLIRVTTLVLTLGFGFRAFAQIEEEKARVPQNEFFFAEATITEVRDGGKMIKAGIKDGLNLTFHASDGSSLRGMIPGDVTEIKYAYNQNYEKVIREINVIERAKREGAASNPEAAPEKAQDLGL